MALQGTGLTFGSGEFVQEREWTCARHDSPMYHECDCEHCHRKWDCRTCARARWVDLTNEDGTPKMRELSTMEVWFRESWREELEQSNRSLTALAEWREDETAPRFVWNEDAL